jgi:hypothetical protein
MIKTNRWDLKPRSPADVLAAGNMFFSWNFEQWAIAAARYPGYGTDYKSASELKTAWSKANYAAPGEVFIEGIDYPRDWDWVLKLQERSLNPLAAEKPSKWSVKTAARGWL